MYHICSCLEETDWHWGMTNCSHKIEQRAITGLTGCVSFSQVLQVSLPSDLLGKKFWKTSRDWGSGIWGISSVWERCKDCTCNCSMLFNFSSNFGIKLCNKLLQFSCFSCLNKYKILHNIVLKCFYLHIFLKWFMKMKRICIKAGTWGIIDILMFPCKL